MNEAKRLVNKPPGRGSAAPDEAAGAPAGTARSSDASQPTQTTAGSAAGADSSRGAGSSQAFSPGDLVAGRYRVVRFIARGGMGDVYEAEDTVLQGRVALKTIRPEIAAGTRGVARFKREIHLARQITHPNVCRVFDLGFHKGPSAHAPTANEGPLFLTMELLRGETLAERIAHGRMTVEQALPIAEQLAAALDAAHRAGIIHRDFKSANVMLVDEPGKGTRAVVTDFGLARACAVDESGHGTLSEAGMMVGTPAYMAPEQVEGKALTSAADIYALGVVLYEMVTQAKPFDGGSPISVAARRLTAAPLPPSHHVPQIDPVWETVILRCLERDPAARYRSALQIVQALRASSGEVTRTLRAPGPRLRRQAAPAPGGAMAATLMVTLVLLNYVAVLLAIRKAFFFFVPEGRYLASVGWPQLMPLLLFLVPSARRSLALLFRDADGRLRHATLACSALVSLAFGGAALALQPHAELRVDARSIDADDPGRPPFDNVTAPTVRGERLCHSREEASDPQRRCDAPIPDSGHLRLRVRLGLNQLAAPRLRLVAGPAGVAFARVRVESALAAAADPGHVRSAGSTLELAGETGRSLDGSFEIRIVLRQLPGEAEEPRLQLSLTEDTEGGHAEPELVRCWSLADGRVGSACRGPAPGGGS
jgi:hypothetical protein